MKFFMYRMTDQRLRHGRPLVVGGGANGAVVSLPGPGLPSIKYIIIIYTFAPVQPSSARHLVRMLLIPGFLHKTNVRMSINIPCHLKSQTKESLYELKYVEKLTSSGMNERLTAKIKPHMVKISSKCLIVRTSSSQTVKAITTPAIDPATNDRNLKYYEISVLLSHHQSFL